MVSTRRRAEEEEEEEGVRRAQCLPGTCNATATLIDRPPSAIQCIWPWRDVNERTNKQASKQANKQTGRIAIPPEGCNNIRQISTAPYGDDFQMCCWRHV